MLKKAISVMLAVLSICFCLIPAYAGEPEDDVISVKLSSNVADYTEKDTDKFIEILSDNVVYSTRGDTAVSVYNYAGTVYDGAVKAGRTYYVSYSLDAADGFTLPEELNDSNLKIECGKGVNVYSKQIVSATKKDDEGIKVVYRGIYIQATVTVDGNIFQRIIGLISDLYIKARAWSLY